MLILGLIASALGAEVLVYGPTNGATGNIEAALTEAGHNVTVWTGTQFRFASSSQFAAFDAIVVGDPDCGGPSAGTYDDFRISGEAWAPIVRGNVLLSGSDAGCHFDKRQAKQFLQQAVAWAASGDETGLYVSSDWGRSTNIATGTASHGATHLQSFADIRSFSFSGDRLELTGAGAVHPVYDGITDTEEGTTTNWGLSRWRTSFHATWTQHDNFPDDFYPVVVNQICVANCGNPGSEVFSTGSHWLHIARDECDFDGDGFDSDGDTCGGTDCDDKDDNVNPSVSEVCDGIDNDCNDGVDERDAIGTSVFYQDLDGDGFGNPNVPLNACTQPARFVDVAGDCHDTVFAANPDGTEIPHDGLDNDCVDGDECDVDGDGFDEDGQWCGGDDCNDDNRSIKPTAAEIWYDGTDQDCNGLSDYDQDEDGHDSENERPGEGDDCDDLDDTVHPGAPELADSKDNDCNGWREDEDSDGDGLFDEDEITAGTLPGDPDSDDDGIPDSVEVGPNPSSPLNTDNDAFIDALDPDDDNDGIPTSVEIDNYDWTVPGSEPPNLDGDGLADHRDPDSDNDGYLDQEEGTVDSDEDGAPDYKDFDSDNDTVLDEHELPGDTDGDELDDRVDDDDDNDTLPTAVENAQPNDDADGDLVPNWLDEDSDSDGVRDEIELDGDDDEDGLLNFVDADDLDGPGAQPTRILKGGGCEGGASVTGLAPSGAWLWLVGLLAFVRRGRR